MYLGRLPEGERLLLPRPQRVGCLLTTLAGETALSLRAQGDRYLKNCKQGSNHRVIIQLVPHSFLFDATSFARQHLAIICHSSPRLFTSQALSGWMGADAYFQVSPEIFSTYDHGVQLA